MTPDELRERIGDDYPNENWHNQCAGLVYYVCRVTGIVRQPYSTATAAAQASLIVSQDPETAPAGAIHFWSYWATINGRRLDYGHTAVSFGNGLALMTDPEDDEETWPGRALGVTRVTDWTRRRRGIVTYLGWAVSYGQNVAKITNHQQEGPLMALTDQQQNDLLDRVTATADAVAGLRKDLDEVYTRVRGERKDVDILQDILGQLTELRRDVEALK